MFLLALHPCMAMVLALRAAVHAFLFWATADTRITEADLAAWSEIFPSNTQLKLEGHKHLFVMDKALTLKWGEGIAKILQEKLA